MRHPAWDDLGRVSNIRSYRNRVAVSQSRLNGTLVASTGERWQTPAARNVVVEGFVRTSNSALRPRSAMRLLASLGLAAIVAGALAPAALAATTVQISTQYPAVVVSPGSKVSFDLSVKTSVAARVDLTVNGAPSGWTAVLHGGQFIVDAVETDGKVATSARLDVSVPDSASGSAHLVVDAAADGVHASLPLDVRVEADAGDVTLTTDVPSVKGASSSTFTFNLTIANETAQDQTFAVDAQGPDGWTTTAELTGQTQAASAIVKAGATSGVTVTAKPPDSVPAGQYPISVVATAGTKQIKQDLTVEVTGSFSLSMSTPNQVLSTSGSSGQATTQQLTITNGGTAPITNVAVSASPPTNWKVTFDTPTIASIAPNQTATVTATIVPSGDAIAGDYQLTFNATSDQQATATQMVRFTVNTSLQWAIIGGALIVLVFVGLWWVFKRYGRR
jgi:uncharacterized membrane protein